MSGPANGKYIIKISWPGQLIEASADNKDNCAVKPVITHGQMKVWSIKDEGDGNYKFVLEDNWYSSSEENKVIVKTSVDPGTRWRLERVKEDLYAIKTSDAPGAKAWTATHDPVILVDLYYGPDQLWTFVPHHED